MLTALFEQFLKEKQYLKGISPLTIKSYRQAFNRFLQSGATQVSKSSLNQFVVCIREKGLATTSCNISIRSMNAFCTWLHENGHTSVGDTVQIGYVEDLGEYQGKTVTYRTIRNFDKDIGEGIKNYESHTGSQSSESRGTSHSGASSEVLKDDAFYEKLAYTKCCSIWAAAVLGRTESEPFEIMLERVCSGNYSKLSKQMEKRDSLLVWKRLD